MGRTEVMDDRDIKQGLRVIVPQALGDRLGTVLRRGLNPTWIVRLDWSLAEVPLHPSAFEPVDVVTRLGDLLNHPA